MSIISTNPIYPDLENMFPASVDRINRFLDPALEDLQTINRYYSYIEGGNLIAANALLDANPKLKQMCLNADSLNPLIDAVISMQRYYISDIQKYLVNIVKAKGDWNASARYTKYDVVQYANKGAIESYIAIAEDIPIGTVPTNIKYFTSLTLRGEQGASGIGLSPKGTWDSKIQYSKDDCVSYNNVLWSAKIDNVNRAPQDVSDTWDVVLKVPKQIVFSTKEPMGQTVDEIWFKEIGANAYEIYKKQANNTYKLVLVNANSSLVANRSLNADNAEFAKTALNSENVLWKNISEKPEVFPPNKHIHTPNEVGAAALLHKHTPSDIGAATEKTYMSTIGTAWVGTAAPYTQAIAVSGMLAADTPIIDLVLSGTAATDMERLEAWGMVGRIVTAANSITVTCYEEKPAVAIPIQLKVVR